MKAANTKPVRDLTIELWHLVLLSACVLCLSACGTAGAKDPKKDFFTSGSREADQRAAQRMAKEEQLADEGNNGKGGSKNGAEIEKRRTLYDRLGADKGLTAIVDDFVSRALQDPRVDWTRQGVQERSLFSKRKKEDNWQPTQQNVETLKKHMVQFLALATGGPAHYEGKEMKSAHAAMKIDNSQFDAAIGDLKASLDLLQIADQEQKELLSIVESTRPQIVTQR